MKTRRVVIDATLNMKREIKLQGSLVRVISGAWTSMRISFDRPPSDDPFPTSDASPVVNGECYFPSDKDTFDSIWISNQTLQGPQGFPAGDSLVLEIFDCVTPVVQLNNRAGAGWRFHWVNGFQSVVEIVPTATSILYQDNNWGATGTLDDATGQEFVPRGFIGGGVTANQTFNLYILQHLTKNGTRRCEYARWKADTLSIVGGDGYGVSFETDGQPKVNSTKTVSQSGATLLPWPLFGITIIIEAIGDITDLQFLLYSRGALT